MNQFSGSFSFSDLIEDSQNSHPLWQTNPKFCTKIHVFLLNGIVSFFIIYVQHVECFTSFPIILWLPYSIQQQGTMNSTCCSFYIFLACSCGWLALLASSKLFSFSRYFIKIKISRRPRAGWKKYGIFWQDASLYIFSICKCLLLTMK